MWWNLKTQIVIQLNNTNWDETHKLKLRQNLTTQIVMKLKDPLWQNSKNQKMTKLKLWQNSSCDKTQIVIKLKLWQTLSCDKTQIVTAQIVKKKKINNLKCDNSNCDKTQYLKWWQNSKTQIVTKLQNSNCDKMWIIIISKNIMTPWQPMRCSLRSNLRFSQCFT